MNYSKQRKDELNSNSSPVQVIGSVARMDGKKLSYEDFWMNFMAKNVPAVLTNLCEEWKSVKEWVNSEGKPNLEFIKQSFGKAKVQVAVCNEKEFSDQKRSTLSVSEFIDNWENKSSSTSSTSSASSTSSISDDTFNNQCKVDENNNHSLLYLKDWHFVKEYSDYGAYQTPSFFIDDWLNEYCDTHKLHTKMNGSDFATSLMQSVKPDSVECSDYRFVYIGKKGTWTPVHADVARSYSWSANVCGRKRWLLLSPDQTNLIRHVYNSNTIFDIFENTSSKQWPEFSKTKWIECIQEEKEIIFVPSGWFHQVINIEDTISINHNWINACNIHWVWRLLQDDYDQTRKSIMDIFDITTNFEELCQRNLACNSGMNFVDFFVFLSSHSQSLLRDSLSLLVEKICKKKIFCTKKNCEMCEKIFSQKKFTKILEYGDSFYPRHRFFNLHRIKTVLLDMNSNSNFQRLILECGVFDIHRKDDVDERGIDTSSMRSLFETDFNKLECELNQVWDGGNCMLECLLGEKNRFGKVKNGFDLDIFGILFVSEYDFVKKFWLDPLALTCLIDVVLKIMKKNFGLNDILNVASIPSNSMYI